MQIEELVVYREYEQEQDAILRDIALIEKNIRRSEGNQEKLKEIYYSCIHRLAEFAEIYGFSGNIWHCYLAWLLVNNENMFSHACEIRGAARGSIRSLALHDFEIFMEFFALDFDRLEEALSIKAFSFLRHYENERENGRIYSSSVRKRIGSLGQRLGTVADADLFLDEVAEFYREFGVGKFGLHKAFRVTREDGRVLIVPIFQTAHVCLDDLVGYENAKKKLIDNTEAFVAGRKANNCLLFGDAGTGKSSSIKGILNKYYDRGLRIIEIYRHQFQDLNDVIAQIKNRNYRFIIYMDDLSFEDFETEYKYLKAVIEGGLEQKPENVLIYATSNRRHLVREKFSDKEDRDDDLHTSETVQEKLSLVYRFGLRIYFGSPGKKEFQNIVRVLAKRSGLSMPEEELLLLANQWELHYGGLSGRTARQFVDHLLGEERE